MVDGHEGSAYDWVDVLLFSPTGVPAYNARVGKQWLMVIGTQAGKLYDEVQGLIFSADGSRHAYVARRGKARFLVVDGVEKTSYDDIGVFDFSPNGHRFAYAGREGKQWVLVVDGKPTKRYDDVESIVFSPDSRRLASVVYTQWKRYMRLDGKEFGPYRDVNPPEFSPDSRHIACEVTNISNDKGFIVIDGKEQPEYDYIGVFDFSPDSLHFAYSSIKDIGGDKQVHAIIVDGKRHPHEYVNIDWLEFSPDSRHLAYNGADDGWTPVIDGQDRDWRGAMGRMVYSPDSKHIAFAAGLTDWNSKPGEGGVTKKWWVVIDGKAGQKYDLILDPTLSECDVMGISRTCAQYSNPSLYADFGWSPGGIMEDPSYSGIFFETPNRIHYLAIKEKGVYLVEAPLG